MFWSKPKQSPPPQNDARRRASKSRLRLECLEDRAVPTASVSVVALQDATEAGSNGTFRLTRTGSTADPLDVAVSIGGTATGGTDYTTIGTTVTIPANTATADVTVAGLSDFIYDPDETVVLTVLNDPPPYFVNWPEYVPATANQATVAITDNTNSVTTTVHEETFTLTGAAGSVSVAVTVTFNPSGAAGEYLWKYVVTNPSSESNSWTEVSIPVADMGTDVGNLTSTNGWTGTVGANAVSWAGGTALAPGNSATFTFRTQPRELASATATVVNGGAQAQGPAVAPGPVAVAPRASLGFYNGIQAYSLKLSITTASGGSYQTEVLAIAAGSGTTARDYVYNYLRDAGWVVEKIGDLGIEIRGVKKMDGTTDGLKTITCTITNYNPPPPPNQSHALKPEVASTSGVTATNN